MTRKILQQISSSRWAVIGILAVAVFAVYWPLITADYISYDDNEQVSHNQDITQLSWQSANKIFHSYYVGMYQPLTTLSYNLEYRLFGSEAPMYHFDNILLHLLVVLLVFKLSLLLFKDRKTALVTALLFALWPTQVETVAWISTRSNLLSALLGLCSIFAYLHFRRLKSYPAYVLSLLLFLAACLAKSSMVVLPFILLILDWHLDADWRKKWLNKIPYLLLAVAIGLAAIMARRSIGAMNGYHFNIWQEIALVGTGFNWQILKLIWPFNQSLIYERGNSGGQLPIFFYIGIALPLFLALLPCLYRKLRRNFLFYLLWFSFLILPSLQILPYSTTFGADRYNYLACLALLWPLALGWSWLHRRKPNLANAALALVILAIAWSSTIYSYSWRNTVTLWDYSLKNSPGSSSIWVNRGIDMVDKDWKTSLVDIEIGLTLNPYNEYAYNARGNLRQDKLHDYKGAINDFSAATQIDSRSARFFYNLGHAYRQLNNWPEAIKAFNSAEQNLKGSSLERDLPYNILINRAYVNYQAKDFKACLQDASAYLALTPDSKEEAYYLKGLAELNLRINSGCTDLKQAADLKHREAAKLYRQYCQKPKK